MKIRHLHFLLIALPVAALLLLAAPSEAGLFSKKPKSPPPLPSTPAPVTNTPPPVVEAPPVVTNAPPVLPVIVWDAPMKEIQVKAGETTVSTFFTLTNVSPVEAVVTAVKPSCGCTTAQLPPMPWTNAPGASGEIKLAINVAGKSGTLFKNVTVETTAGHTVLQIKLIIPDAGAMRAANMQLAAKDRQAVFKGDCASCHVTPGIGKMGAELYKAVCGVCHEAEHRATMVADLHHLNHPTSRDHWKTWITSGKPDSLMPAFAQSLGGPLTPEQIDSLADYLTEAITATEGTNFTPQVVAPPTVPQPAPPAAH